jgi:hypothetical protein
VVNKDKDEVEGEVLWKVVEFPESIEPAQDDQGSEEKKIFGNILKEYYEASIEERLEYIKFIGAENKTFQELRENHQDDWEIVELCREILFKNAKLINFLQEGIGNDRKEIRKLSRVRRSGQSNLFS